MSRFCAVLVLTFLTYFAVSADEECVAHITYTLWINDNISEIHTLSLTVPENTTFYKVMEIASTIDSHYEFEASSHPEYGHYVYRIANTTERTSDSVYWMLYVLKDLPNPNNPPNDKSLSDWGVDTLRVHDCKHYLFWYRTYIYQGTADPQ